MSLILETLRNDESRHECMNMNGRRNERHECALGDNGRKTLRDRVWKSSPILLYLSLRNDPTILGLYWAKTSYDLMRKIKRKTTSYTIAETAIRFVLASPM